MGVLADLKARVFSGAKKKDAAQVGGALAQIFSQFTQGDSPRLTQSNMGTFLSKYADQAWIFSCIKIIQSKGAGVPLKVYKKVGNGEDEIELVANHPLQELIERVNPFMNGYDLLESTHGFIELVGNAYWLLDMMVDGKPTELYPLNPKCIKIMVDKKRNVTGYAYELMPGVVDQTFSPAEILHFKTWNPLDDFYGLAPICAARDSSDMLMFSDQYNKAFFKNGAEPGGYLTADQSVDEDERRRISSTWKKLHQGARRAHSVAVLDGGLKFQPSTTNHRDMAFSDLKRMTREDVLTVFNMPPIMVGVFDEANYSNAREQRRIFWQDCMIPRMKKLESVINEKLVKPYDPNLIVKHDLKGVEDLAEDADTRSRSDSYNVQAGILTVNEIRKLKNLPAVPWGDTWYAPMGLSPVTVNGTDPDDDEVTPTSDEPATTPPPKPPAAPAPAADAPAAKPPKKSAIPKESVTAPVDPQVVRRDLVWMKYKGLTERQERKWAPVMRGLFNDQEREVIHNLRDSGWQRTVNQNHLEKMRRVKQSIDVILFDRVKARTIFRRDAHKLMTETLEASAAEQIKDYDLGIDFNILDHHVTSWVNSKAFKFADEVNMTTEDALRWELSDAISAGETIKDVEDRVARVFDIARGSRTAMIARTEVISASNEGAYESYKQSGVVEKSEWISSRDNKVRDEHQIDGETVELGQSFSNGLQFPGDPEGEPGNVINCRCTIAPIVNKGDE